MTLRELKTYGEIGKRDEVERLVWSQNVKNRRKEELSRKCRGGRREERDGWERKDVCGRIGISWKRKGEVRREKLAEERGVGNEREGERGAG